MTDLTSAILSQRLRILSLYLIMPPFIAIFTLPTEMSFFN